jgi:hypothetical protein
MTVYNYDNNIKPAKQGGGKILDLQAQFQPSIWKAREQQLWQRRFKQTNWTLVIHYIASLCFF